MRGSLDSSVRDDLKGVTSRPLLLVRLERRACGNAENEIALLIRCEVVSSLRLPLAFLLTMARS